MYSSNAVVTAAFLVLWSPIRRASSIRLSSIARLVAMCGLLHIGMCGAILLQTRNGQLLNHRTHENRGRFPVPGVLTASALLAKLCYSTPTRLLHLIQFHVVARVDIFQREHNHRGRGRRRDSNDDDLPNRPP